MKGDLSNISPSLTTALGDRYRVERELGASKNSVIARRLRSSRRGNLTRLSLSNARSDQLPLLAIDGPSGKVNRVRLLRRPYGLLAMTKLGCH